MKLFADHWSSQAAAVISSACRLTVSAKLPPALPAKPTEMTMSSTKPELSRFKEHESDGSIDDDDVMENLGSAVAPPSSEEPVKPGAENPSDHGGDAQ